MSGEWIAQLDGRLCLVADMVPPGARVADVGCDHARLPIALVSSGRCPLVIASDLRRGPLLSARGNVARAGLEDKIELRLCDGLDGIKPGEADCVVMAGMGGILITQIMERASWLKDSSICLVLQPMRDAHLVRRTLWDEGFALECERAAVANHRVYSVLRARYCGITRHYTPTDCYDGLLSGGGELERRKLEQVVRSLSVQINGLAGSGKDSQRLDNLQTIREELSQRIQQMKY